MKIPVHPGDQLDHYRIEGVADHNGSTSVFRGTDLRTNQPVSIKIPHPEVESDPVFVERFQREEELGKSLDHPGILKVFADEYRTQSYILTQWLDGQAPRQHLTRSKPSQQ